MLAGLSQCWTFSTPPDFCATAGAATISAPTAMNRHRTRCIFEAPPLLLVEPHVFHTEPVVNRVHRHRVALDVRVPAGARDAVVEHRPRDILGQLLLDLPHHLPALLLIGLHRLPLDHLVQFGIAVAVVIAFGIAGVVLVERLVWLIETVADQVEADRKVLFGQPRVPHRRVDRLQFAVDIDLLQLVDQEHRRVAVGRDIARRDLRLQPVVRAVAELFHQLARLSPVCRYVRTVTRQGPHQIRGHAPDAEGRRQQGAADDAFALRQRIDEGLPVAGERDRTAHIRIAERGFFAVDYDAAEHIGRSHVTDFLSDLLVDVVQHRHLQEIPRGYVDLARHKSERAGRYVFYDLVLDAIEIRPVLLPVIGVARDLYVFVRFELDEFEWPGADRLLAHLRGGYGAGIDRREPRCEQRNERWLRPLQSEGHVVIAIRHDVVEVAVP